MTASTVVKSRPNCSYTQTLVRSLTEETLIKLFSKNGWMPELQQRHPTSFPRLHHETLTLYTLAHSLFSTHTHTNTHYSYVLILRNAQTHTHKPSPALSLRWNYRSVPFPHGALPATHSTLPVCDPSMCWKRKHLTYCPLLLMCSHRLSSYAEYGLSTVNTPLSLWGRLTCLLNLIFDVFLSSVSFYSHPWAAMDSFLLWRSIRENINLRDWHLIPSLGR